MSQSTTSFANEPSTASPPAPPIADLDDSTLVARAQDHDVEAFGELLSRWEDKLYRYAYGMLGSRADAEDALQDTLVRAWRSLPKLSEPAAFSGWIYRTLTRRCLDILNTPAKRRAQLLAPEDMPEQPNATYDQRDRAGADPADVVVERVTLDEVAKQLQTLPPGQRSCWLLHEVHGQSYAEISSVLAIPVSTVRGRLVQARRRLAEGMQSWR